MLAPVSLISMLASCPGEGLGDAVGLGEGLGDGLAVGLGVACGLAGSVGVCHALTGEIFKTNRVRRSKITAAAPLSKFIGCILLFRKLILTVPLNSKIAPLMRLP